MNASDISIPEGTSAIGESGPRKRTSRAGRAAERSGHRVDRIDRVDHTVRIGTVGRRHGGGRTAATVLGAVGGGHAGHVAEGYARTETRYQVRVRMADGSLRTVETRTAPPRGKPVTLRDTVLRPADGRA